MVMNTSIIRHPSASQALAVDKGRLRRWNFMAASSRTGLYAPVRPFIPPCTRILLDGQVPTEIDGHVTGHFAPFPIPRYL